MTPQQGSLEAEAGDFSFTNHYSYGTGGTGLVLLEQIIELLLTEVSIVIQGICISHCFD